MARGKKITNPATCHPTRETYMDGMCGVCYFDNRRVPTDPKRLEERKELVRLHQDVARVDQLAKEAKAILKENLPRYAELHLTAAEVAAADGDARPAEWALQANMGGEPVAKSPKASEGAGGGVKIYIGVKVGGIPEDLVVSANSEPS